jgi:hypothetical protein
MLVDDYWQAANISLATLFANQSRGIAMKGALITVAIGFLVLIADWHLATKPDEKDKIKRRKALSPVDRKRLRDIFVMTFVIAGGVWLATYFLSD